jgi:hypothetical protein
LTAKGEEIAKMKGERGVREMFEPIFCSLYGSYLFKAVQEAGIAGLQIVQYLV